MVSKVQMVRLAQPTQAVAEVVVLTLELAAMAVQA
jgi:hypothetical protein